MLRTELITHFREMADDLVDNPYLWPDNLVNSYAILAENEACSRKPLLVDRSTEALCKIDVTEGTSAYTTNSAVRQIFKASLIYDSDTSTEIRLYITDIDELNVIDPDWQDDTSLTKYLIVEDSSVTLWPVPEDDAALWLEVSHVPLTEEASFTISSSHHFMLVFYMLYLAYNKSDSDTHNPKRAYEYEAIFSAYFGPKPDANKVKSVRQVRSDRSIQGWPI